MVFPGLQVPPDFPVETPIPGLPSPSQPFGGPVARPFPTQGAFLRAGGSLPAPGTTTATSGPPPPNHDGPWPLNAGDGQQDGWLYRNGVPFEYIFPSGAYSRVPAGLLDGGAGAGGPTQAELDIQWFNARINEAAEERMRARDEWQRAIAEGNLEVAQRAEARMRASDERMAQLQAQANAISLQGQRQQAQAALSNVMAQTAGQAAQFAARPFDAFAYLNLAKAAQGQGLGTMPMQAALSTPALQRPYTAGLEGAFQKIFGGLGEQFERQRQAINAPLPNIPLPGAGPSPWEHFGTLQPNVQQSLLGMTPEQAQNLARLGGAGVVSSAGGGKFTVNEPAVAVGLRSGVPLFTFSEQEPEKITITPLNPPPKPDQGGKSVPSFQEGGTVIGGVRYSQDPRQIPDWMRRGFGLPGRTATPAAPAATGTDQTPEQAFAETRGEFPRLAEDLAGRLRENWGVNWQFTPGTGAFAPPPGALAGKMGRLKRRDPTTYDLLLAAAAASGYPSPEAFTGLVREFSPRNFFLGSVTR